MGTWVAAACGVAGTVVGAGLARAAYRLSVPAGEPVRTSCHHCGIPVSGWWSPRGCAGCDTRLGPAGWSTGIAGGLACAGVGWRLGLGPELVPYLLATALGVLLAAVDLACLRLPDVLVKPGFVIALGMFGLLAVAQSAWPSLLRAGLAAGVFGGAYLLLAVLPGGALGYGDVKLAGLLGLLLGWLGWREVLAGVLLPFVINGVAALFLLASRRATRHTLVPFGPAMLIGAWLPVVTLTLWT